jgi:hypothetical protein
VYSEFDESKKEFAHKYCCFGYTYQSADGEYRRHFISTLQLYQNWELHKSILEPWEDYVIESQRKGKLLLQFNPQFPHRHGNKLAKEFEKSIDKTRLGIKLFTLSFIEYVKHYYRNTTNAMMSKEDESAYLKLAEKSGGIEKLFRLYNIFEGIRPDVATQHISTECGQKITMLKAKEIEEIENIRYNPWREFYIARQCSDLVINVISPHFSIMKDYFLISSASKYLFDNPVNLIKIDHSKAATQTVKKLEKIRQETYVIDPKTKKELYASYKFEGFSDAINIPMDYAEKNLVMSDYSICFLSEHIGITFGNLPKELSSDETVREKIGPVFQDFRFFSKMIFEYLYGLYCMNSKLGVIHSDLHVNNAVMFNKNVFAPGALQGHYNSYILYNLEGKLYTFPHTGELAGIIDFSRGIISTENAHKNFNKRIAAYIIEKEKKQILNKLQMVMPEFVKENRTGINVAIEANFDTVFRLLTSIDMFIFTAGAIHVLRGILTDRDALREFASKSMIEKEAIPLLQSIHDESYEIFTSGVRRLISGERVELSRVEFPNLSIISKFFSGFLASNLKLSPENKEKFFVSDYYSTQNELKFSVKNYDDFPPTVKFDYIRENNLPIDVIGRALWKEHEEYEERVDPEEEVEAIKERAEKKKIERRGLKTKPEKSDKLIIEAEPGFSSDDTYYDT